MTTRIVPHNSDLSRLPEESIFDHTSSRRLPRQSLSIHSSRHSSHHSGRSIHSTRSLHSSRSLHSNRSVHGSIHEVESRRSPARLSKHLSSSDLSQRPRSLHSSYNRAVAPTTTTTSANRSSTSAKSSKNHQSEDSPLEPMPLSTKYRLKQAVNFIIDKKNSTSNKNNTTAPPLESNNSVDSLASSTYTSTDNNNYNTNMSDLNLNLRLKKEALIIQKFRNNMLPTTSFNTLAKRMNTAVTDRPVYIAPSNTTSISAYTIDPFGCDNSNSKDVSGEGKDRPVPRPLWERSATEEDGSSASPRIDDNTTSSQEHAIANLTEHAELTANSSATVIIDMSATYTSPPPVDSTSTSSLPTPSTEGIATPAATPTATLTTSNIHPHHHSHTRGDIPNFDPPLHLSDTYSDDGHDAHEKRIYDKYIQHKINQYKVQGKVIGHDLMTPKHADFIISDLKKIFLFHSPQLFFRYDLNDT